MRHRQEIQTIKRQLKMAERKPFGAIWFRFIDDPEGIVRDPADMNTTYEEEYVRERSDGFLCIERPMTHDEWCDSEMERIGNV